MAPPYEKVEVTGTGDQVLIAGVVGKIINVNRAILTFKSDDDVDELTIVFKSGSTALTGPMIVSNPGEIVLDYVAQNPWHVIASGEHFIANLSNTTTVAGMIYYTQPNG